MLLQRVDYLEMLSRFPSELCLLLSLTSSVHCGHRHGLYGTHSQVSVGTTGVRDAPGFGRLGAGACCATGSSTRRAGCGPCTQSQRPRLQHKGRHGSASLWPMPTHCSVPHARFRPLCAAVSWASLSRVLPLGPASPLPASLCRRELGVSRARPAVRKARPSPFAAESAGSPSLVADSPQSLQRFPPLFSAFS